MHRVLLNSQLMHRLRGLKAIITTASIPLACDEATLGSTVCELLGCLRADLSLLSMSVKNVIIICDNLSTMLMLKRSSSIPILASLIAALFLKCIKYNRQSGLSNQLQYNWLTSTTGLGIITPFMRLLPSSGRPTHLSDAYGGPGSGFHVDRAASFVSV